METIQQNTVQQFTLKKLTINESVQKIAPSWKSIKGEKVQITVLTTSISVEFYQFQEWRMTFYYVYDAIAVCRSKNFSSMYFFS